MTELRTRHLLPALLVAAALHAGGAILIFQNTPAPGAAGAGQGGLEIGIGLAGGAAGRAGAEKVTPAEREPAPAETVRAAAVSEIEPTAPSPDWPPPPSTRIDAAEATPLQSDTVPEPVASADPSVSRAAEPAAARTSAVPTLAAAPPSAQPTPDVVRPAPTASTPPGVATAPPLSGDVTPSPPQTVEPADTPTAASLEDMTPDSDAEPSRLTETPATRTVRAKTVRTVEPDQPDRQIAAPSSTPTPRARPARAEPRPLRAARAVPKADRTEPKPERPDRQSPETSRPDPAGQENGAAVSASDTGSDGRTTQGDATGQGGNAGSGRTASLGGNPGARNDYMARIAAILAREKRYPRRARIRREEGTGHLRFTLDASGHVIAQSVARSTGHASLDEEIAALLGRAAPLPPIPPEVGRDTLEIVVPIRFRLR